MARLSEIWVRRIWRLAACAAFSVSCVHQTQVSHTAVSKSATVNPWERQIRNAVDAALETDGRVEIGWSRNHNQLDIWVSDEGPGLANTANLFVPFFTTKAPGVGTGLGLHIAYNIVVHKHRGQIQVASRPGETCLRVELPIRLAGNNAGVS